MPRTSSVSSIPLWIGLFLLLLAAALVLGWTLYSNDLARSEADRRTLPPTAAVRQPIPSGGDVQQDRRGQDADKGVRTLAAPPSNVPPPDPIAAEIRAQKEAQDQGKIWSFAWLSDELTYGLSWIEPRPKDHVQNAAERLVGELLRTDDSIGALAILDRAPEGRRVRLIQVMVHAIRRQHVPMGEPQTTSSPDAPSAQERLERHNQLKANYVAQKNSQFRQLLSRAAALPANEDAAQALEDVREAFRAVDDSKGVKDAQQALTTCVRGIFFAEIESNGIWGQWFDFALAIKGALLATLGTASLGVFAKIVTSHLEGALSSISANQRKDATTEPS